MNKLNIKEELTESSLAIDKSEISFTFQKETKKLTRLPFYKLEELKKQEEKKAKHRNKINKKEDVLIPHVGMMDKSGKKKRIILKKIKEEKPKTKQEILPTNQNIVTDTSNQNKSELAKKLKVIADEKYANLVINHSGNSLQTLKYSTDEIVHKKIKLSRKQRKLQEAENTLASFMSKEDKSTLYQNNSSKYVNNDDYHDKVFSSSLNMNALNVTNLNNLNNTSNNVNASSANLNNTIVKKNDNNVNLELLGKKKRRINKFKKAVYKYRFRKKQFIFDNVFKLDNNNNNTIINADNTNNVINKDNDINENKTMLQSEVILNKTQPEIAKTDVINNKQENTVISIKPNYIEKKNFYIESNRQPDINRIDNNSHIQNNFSNYGHPTLPTMYINYNNNFYQYNMPPYNYPHYFYPYYPMNMNMYNNGQYYYQTPYNYTYGISYVDKSDNNYLNKDTINHNKVYEKGIANNNTHKQEIKNNTDVKREKSKKKNKNKNILNKFDMIDDKLVQNLNNSEKKGFLFEKAEESNQTNAFITKDYNSEEFRNYLKSTYHIDKDISNLNGIELNNYLKEHTLLKKVDLQNLKKIADQKTIDTYIKNFEGVLPDINTNKRIIREYVDQILDHELDKKFGDFIVKMRDLYYKKKQAQPLKAKKRFVVGMREIEKHIRLEEVKCLFIVPNIEKVEGENSLDDRLVKIFKDCETKRIPKIFGMNKFKLGKLARKKHSCVSMLAFVNVEGFEREFRELIEFAKKFRTNFYERYKYQKEAFRNNRFINFELFENSEQ